MISKFYYESPIGMLEITVDEDAVTSLRVTDSAVNPSKNIPDNIKTQLDEYFGGKRNTFDIKINLQGTNFQQKVWNALTKIPYGETKSYGEIAELIGKKGASRAVGMACNKNPILIVIPCHRVIGKNGNLTGFACGLNVKEKLLKLESNCQKFYEL